MTYILLLEREGTRGRFEEQIADDELAELPYLHEYGDLPAGYELLYVTGDDDPQWQEIAKLPTVYGPSELGMAPLDPWYMLWGEYAARKGEEDREKGEGE